MVPRKADKLFQNVGRRMKSPSSERKRTHLLRGITRTREEQVARCCTPPSPIPPDVRLHLDLLNAQFLDLTRFFPHEWQIIPFHPAAMLVVVFGALDQQVVDQTWVASLRDRDDRASEKKKPDFTAEFYGGIGVNTEKPRTTLLYFAKTPLEMT